MNVYYVIHEGKKIYVESDEDDETEAVAWIPKGYTAVRSLLVNKRIMTIDAWIMRKQSYGEQAWKVPCFFDEKATKAYHQHLKTKSGIDFIDVLNQSKEQLTLSIKRNLDAWNATRDLVKLK